MEIGVSVPIVEIGDDFGALRDYIQAAEDLGYAHVRILDHVLGAVPEKHPEVPQFPYTHESYIHEPFTLMAYLAAVTKKIGLTTGILILPQRQTALVAKQAAEVDVLSGGRVRLGIGVGWNSVEYEALGVDFATRGSRCDEQIEVLRQLWTEDVIDYHGKYHDITHAGINPLPVQRPIPIWIGAGRGNAPTPPNAAIRRIGRLADGYFPISNRDRPSRRVPHLNRRIAGSFQPYWPRVLTIGLLILVTAGLGVVNPILIRVVFDSALFADGGPNLPLLWTLATVMATVVVVTGSLGVLQTWLTQQVGQRVMRDLRDRLYSHLQSLSLGFFTSQRTGEIQSRVSNDVAGIRVVVTGTVSNILSNVVILISTLVAMAVLSWELTVVAAGITPIFAVFSYLVGKRRRAVSARVQESTAEMTAITQETLSVSGVMLTRLFGAQNREVARFPRSERASV
ncbi:Uncharacterized protein Mb0965c [Geodia barretti]|uniref:Uncharacterized protein Mb0965c n=1 Tax=Geodia barretti TaxID=519541 RepID=A0AA35W881_GEOBA|nr:Uncharacterized protein Mb0965c [Geodia barretti]